MNYAEKGDKAYLISIVMVAVIGGLLFGYDTAVISGSKRLRLLRCHTRYNIFQRIDRLYYR